MNAKAIQQSANQLAWVLGEIETQLDQLPDTQDPACSVKAICSALLRGIEDIPTEIITWAGEDNADHAFD